MKTNHLVFLFLLFSFCACSNDKQPAEKTGNDINAASEFIRSALDGKFKIARTYMLPDSSNSHYMDAAERNFEKADDDTKAGYHNSSIHIHEVKPVNDSTTIVIYSNSFKNDHDTLKVIKIQEHWLVDLKYLYEHDMDTTQSFNKADTLK
jgi:hypothetical protein